MTDDALQLNVPLLRRRVPNLSGAARSVGLRPATVSDLCTGKIPIGRAEIRTLVGLASLAGCSLDELVLRSGRTGMLETGIKPVDLLAPLDTVWQLALQLAVRTLYPAIDPIASTSALLESAQVEAFHLALAQRARRTLRRYREWRAVVALRGLEHLPGDEQTTYGRGER